SILSATSPNPFIPQAHAHYRGEKQTRLGNVTSVREELAPHVHDINRALGNKVSEQEIERELSSYLNVYRVSLDTAKRSIVKKHGGNPATLAVGVSKPTPVRVVDLREGASNVAVTARILAIERREVEVDGNPKAVFSGILADETGKTQFSAWKDFDLKAEEVVRIEGAYVKSWRGI